MLFRSAERIARELRSGERLTWLYQLKDRPVAEISLVFSRPDPDYVIPGRRAYVSHLVVKPEYRRRGIGRTMVRYVADRAVELGYQELSIGVDLDNYAALRLYAEEGFDRILRVDRDEQGEYVKLLKIL